MYKQLCNLGSHQRATACSIPNPGKLQLTFKTSTMHFRQYVAGANLAQNPYEMLIDIEALDMTFAIK